MFLSLQQKLIFLSFLKEKKKKNVLFWHRFVDLQHHPGLDSVSLGYVVGLYLREITQYMYKEVSSSDDEQ